MIKYLIAFILIASPCIAGVGIGGFPYPGPGMINRTYTLTIDGTDWNGTDLVSVGGSTYTADGTKTGLSGATSITVTPDTGREATCSGTGITGSSSPYSADMSADRTIACTFSATSSATISDDFSTNTVANYTVAGGSLAISGGAAHGSSWANTYAAHNTSMPVASMWGEADVEAAGGDFSCLRVSDYRACVYSGSGEVFLQGDAGSEITGASYNGGYAAGVYRLRLEVPADGQNIKVYVNGTLRITKNYLAMKGSGCGMTFSRGSVSADVTVDNLSCGSL